MALKLGFIGTGKMAGAIIGGIIGAGLVSPQGIGVYDVNPCQQESFTRQGCRAFEDIPSLVSGCGTVFLCVKPQSFPEIMPLVKEGMRPDTLLVSIAAGITAQSIKRSVGFDCKIVLAMPNTPLMLGQGAVALARIEPTTVDEFEQVKSLFVSVGAAQEIDSALMCEVIPVNGSSPAFIYLFAKILIDKAVQTGMDESAAKNLMIQTLIGSAYMLRDTGFTPDELIDMVCSPGGTTIAALDELHRQDFTGALSAAFDTCVGRAKELSEG